MSKWKSLLAQAINDVVSQSWTIFGLLVGWIVLPDGETRDFVGATLGVLTLAWAVTMPLRVSFDEDED
jgi:hypothetical protein